MAQLQGAQALTQDELQDVIKADMGIFEERLSEQLSGARGVINDVTAHLAKAGGKRMRPALTFLWSHVVNPGESANDNVMACALVVELTHLATLYHDDVMDCAPSRRGVETVQRLWGNNRAILAGDVIFARASSFCAQLGPEATRQHARTFERLCMGQLNETFGPEKEDDPVEFYIRVLADKTGSLIAQAARFGVDFAGGDSALSDMAALYGEKVGVAFQIADDVLDIISEPEVSGKTPGTDLKEGVDTLPILLLRRALRDGTIDDEGKQILSLLAHRDDEQIAQVVALLRTHPVLEQTRQMARQWASEAQDAIASLSDTTAGKALIDFADALTDRLA